LIGVLNIEQSKTLLTSIWLNEKGHAALLRLKREKEEKIVFDLM
jgi:hypothetical protein